MFPPPGHGASKARSMPWRRGNYPKPGVYWLAQAADLYCHRVGEAWRCTMKKAALFLVLAASFLIARSSYALPDSTTTVNTVAISDDPNDGKCDLYEAMSAAWDYDHGNDSDNDGSLSTYHGCATGSAPHMIVFSGP